MHWIIAGGTGFLGSALTDHLVKLGFKVTVLTRSKKVDKPGVRFVKWDPSDPQPIVSMLNGSDVLVNLCGRSVDTRYTPSMKQELYASRLTPTRTLGAASRACENAPKVILQMSTAAIYADTTTQVWKEDGELGEGFSVELAKEWEHTAEEHFDPMSRLVKLRTSIVLDPKAGAYPPFRQLAFFGFRGFGGRNLKFSWIHVQDFCRSSVYLATHDISGPVNIAAMPCQLSDMMSQVARERGSKAILKMPEWMVEMGALLMRTESELLLKSRSVIGDKLLRSDFHFWYPVIEDAVGELENDRTPADVNDWYADLS